MTVCPNEHHERLKAHSLLVFLFVADYIGVQYDRDGTLEFVLGNCPVPACRSTLAYTPKPWEVL